MEATVGTPSKTVINMPENNSGIDAATAAMLANNNNNGINSMWPLLLLLGRGGFGGWGGGYGYGAGSPAASAVATDVVLSPAFQSVQNQIQTLSGQVGQNALIDTIEHNRDSIDAGITSINQNISGTSRDTLNSIANLSTAQATGNFTTLQSINGLGRDVTAQANQNALQQLNSFNNLTTTTLQGFNSAAMQNQNATNQIIAQGTQNAAAVASGFCQLSREMAECCCDLKSTIKDDGALTRALLTDNRMHDLEQQLAAANLAASQSAQTNQLENFMRRFFPIASSSGVIV